MMPMLQTPAPHRDAARQLPGVRAGGDDAAAAQARRHQSRALHRLARHHDQGQLSQIKHYWYC